MLHYNVTLLSNKIDFFSIFLKNFFFYCNETEYAVHIRTTMHIVHQNSIRSYGNMISSIVPQYNAFLSIILFNQALIETQHS